MRSHLLFALFGTVAALTSRNNLAVHQVYDFQPKSWLENLAVRSDGHILATRFDVPQLYQFSPLAGFSNATLIHTFNSATGLTGITELSGYPDTFAVIAGNFSVETVPGNHTLWRVDMRQSTPKVTKIADISPDSSIPNGMASLGADENAVLISDSGVGNVWRLDLRTGTTAVVIDDPKMKSVQADNPLILGINGIRIFGRHLYFINSDAAFLARIPIHANGTAAGPSEIVGYSIANSTFDDFAIYDDGTADIASGTGNAVTRIRPDGTTTVIAGNLNSTELANPTSVQLGRTEKDRRTLYVTTSGGDETMVNIVGAQLAAVQLPW